MYRDTIQNMNETELSNLKARLDINQEAEADEVCEFIADREGLFECIEDDILDTFTNGSYSFGGVQMLEANIQPRELIAWLEDQREERGEAYFDNIDLEAVISIVESYNEARKAYKLV